MEESLRIDLGLIVSEELIDRHQLISLVLLDLLDTLAVAQNDLLLRGFGDLVQELFH